MKQYEIIKFTEKPIYFNSWKNRILRYIEKLKHFQFNYVKFSDLNIVI